jgi:hypothetical protein
VAEGGVDRIERVLDQLETFEQVADEMQSWAADKRRLRDYLCGTGAVKFRGEPLLPTELPACPGPARTI